MEEVLSQSTVPAGDQSVINDDLSVLADEVARNREIAGLHYPSDSAGGKDLAGSLLTALKNCPPLLPPGASANRFNNTIRDAAGEWS
jgi:hypothetical protein